MNNCNFIAYNLLLKNDSIAKFNLNLDTNLTEEKAYTLLLEVLVKKFNTSEITKE